MTIEGILPKGPYLPCVSMAGRALLAGYNLTPTSVWDSCAGVRRYFHPHDIFTPGWKYRYDILIFSPLLRYFHPLTIINGKCFCSEISFNYIMCLYNKEHFYTFYGFLQILIHHRLLIQSIKISPEALSFNSKEGIMLKYNDINPKFHGVNICIWMIKPWYHRRRRVKFGSWKYSNIITSNAWF